VRIDLLGWVRLVWEVLVAMPNLNDIFPSRYLKAHDLQGREPVVTIERVEFEAMGGTREVLPVVYFVGKTKALKLNKTMAQAIAALAGSEQTEQWAGVRLTLYATTASFAGQQHAVVRVKAAAAADRTGGLRQRLNEAAS
jgi:hypothetical protein